MGSLLCGAGGQPGRHRRNSSDYGGDSVDGGDSYAGRARIDDEVLAERYRHRMRPQQPGAASVRRRSDHCRVAFRLESFDSQASTESERLNYVARLIDSLPETFLDDRDDGGKSERLQQPAAAVTVSALVNVMSDDSGTAAAPASQLPLLSDSSHSHTYESLKSAADVGHVAGGGLDGERSTTTPQSSPSSPSPSPPPPRQQLAAAAAAASPAALSSPKPVELQTMKQRMRTGGGRRPEAAAAAGATRRASGRRPAANGGQARAMKNAAGGPDPADRQPSRREQVTA